MRIRATLRLRNDKMLAARAELGLSQKQVAIAAETNANAVGALERLDYRCISVDVAIRVARFLDLPLDVVLPPELQGQAIPNSVVSLADVSSESLLAYTQSQGERFLLPGPDTAAEFPELRERVEAVLGTLSLREREIVKMRYGLSDGFTYSSEEVGRIFKITGSRVQQIEAKAVRKLQHPVRAKKLAGFLEEVRPSARDEEANRAGGS